MAAGSGGDPLAELARLIGQNDPFSEFGRDGARRAAAPSPAEWDAQLAGAEFGTQAVAPDPRAHAADSHGGANNYYAAAPAPAAQPPMLEAHPYGTPNFARQSYGGAPLATDAELYRVENEAPGYAPAGGYENDPYNRSKAHLAGEEEDVYDDVPPTRRRIGIMAIAAVFALAVIGTAGAFGYRALFGSSGSSLPPPVIKADTAPSKIVPTTGSKDAQSNKLINDRLSDRGQGERLVSREEQPVEIKDRPAGSGVLGNEPKKVRTIAIRPDQSGTADAMPVSAPPAAQAPARMTTVAPAKQAAPAPPPPRVVSNPDPEPAPAPRQPVARVAPAVRQAAAPNAPLSLNPDAPAAQARAAAPVRTATVAAPAQIAPAAASSGNGGAGGYAVQISSQRSEAEAQAAFRSLQGKYPSQLGGRQPLIHRVDLGEKGIYYRAMVGPFGSTNEAGELCSSLKAAGGQCIVQRN